MIVTPSAGPRGHEDVCGSEHRGAGTTSEEDGVSGELTRLRMNVASFNLDFRSERSEAFQMEVNRTVPMTQPPGKDTLAALRRPSRGPRMQMLPASSG